MILEQVKEWNRLPTCLVPVMKHRNQEYFIAHWIEVTIKSTKKQTPQKMFNKIAHSEEIFI